jgi:putative membrane protein
LTNSDSQNPFVSSAVETPIVGAQPNGVSTALDTNGEGREGEGKKLNISGLLVGFVTGLPQLIFPLAAAFFGTRGSDNPMISVIAVGAILFFSLFFRWLAWMRFRYHIGEHDIRIESGILSRNARSIPYERIQDVSIEQKPLARVMGLSEVKFETGGGDGDDAKLSFVSLEEADRLRDVVRAHKSGAVVAGEAEEVVHDDTPPIFAMDGKRVFTLGLYSFSLVIFAVLGGLAQQFDFLLPYDLWDFGHWIGLAEERGVSVDDINGIGVTAQVVFALGALGALLFIGLATGVIRTLLRDHGFRLERTAKGFRRRRGLLTLTDAVMPAHRVQAAVIQTGPIRKRRGWHSLKFVSLAQDSKDETNFVAAPFATLGEIWPIAQAAMIEAPDAAVRFRNGRFAWWLIRFAGLLPVIAIGIAAMMIFADVPFQQAGWMLLVPIFIGFLWWLEWRKYGDRIDDSQIYVREGWWRQSLTIAPQVKVQTVEIAQGPISRRQGLASLNFGIAGGTLEMVALPLETARVIRDAVMERVAAVDYSEIARA